MNLHDIVPTNPTAIAWLTPIGGNGAVAGAGQYQHLYRIERRPPPPRDTVDPRFPWRRNPRQFFDPWNPNHTDPRAPLCGRLRTQARQIDMNQWAHWNGNGRCPRCIELNLVAEDLHNVRARDPWHQLEWQNRDTTPDPVTGL